MSKNKLTVALVISLSFNVAVLSVFGYLYFSNRANSGDVSETAGNTACDPYRCSRFARSFGLHPEKVERFTAEMSSYGEEESELRYSIMESRHRLMDMLHGKEPDEAEVMKQIDEISGLQGKLEKILAKRLLRVNSVLSVSERERLHTLLRNRMGPGMRGNGCLKPPRPAKRRAGGMR